MSEKTPLAEKVLQRLKRPSNLEKLTTEFGVGYRKIKDAITELRSQGYEIHNRQGTYFLNLKTQEENEVVVDLPSHFKFALFGDTHIGSKHVQLENLHEFYTEAEREGVQFFAHAGDLVQGVGIFPTEASELRDFTMADQMDRVNREYPKSKLSTYLIWGNHDLKQFEKGRSPHPSTALQRPQLISIGDYLGRIRGKKTDVSIDLFHPAFGHSYARSYHLQRHIDQLHPDERPSILGQGHQHDTMYFYHGGVHAFKTATFQGSSNFSKRLSMHTTIGGWIVEGRHDGERITEIKPRFIHYE